VIFYADGGAAAAAAAGMTFMKHCRMLKKMVSRVNQSMRKKLPIVIAVFGD